MDYIFTNGTPQQKQLWAEGSKRLLNLPSSALNLTVTVAFAKPSEVELHNHTDLALTSFIAGGSSSTTLVRDDAPGFGSTQAGTKSLAASMGLDFSAARFYTETAVHELGHSAYASLGEAEHLAIARLFGLKGDDQDELAPSGQPWQNMVAEGIAETFKEAFLPARFRVFPNRTNRKISYSKYPLFRSLVREGLEGITGEQTVIAEELDLEIVSIVS